MWNPDQYLRFEQERTRPSVDLCARVPGAPFTILDAGCGPGNSTEVLRRRWPQAAITGQDLSAEMIAQARERHPEGNWVEGDLRDFRGGPFDLVFSNAVLQWIPGHRRLLAFLLDLVAPGGRLAVQMPSGSRAPFRMAAARAAAEPGFRDALRGASKALTFHGPAFYYDVLAPKVTALDLWETTYVHALPGHQSVVDWMEGTGLRPFLERLDPDAQARFKARVRHHLEAALPLQADGKVLLPFRRLFIVAAK